MKVIVGLGNPGEEHRNTRHNIGFLVLDALLKKYEDVDKTFWDEDRKNKALVKKIVIEKEQALLIKPTTFMNNSGISVSGIVNYIKAPHEDIIVVHDDLDLPFGKIRIRFGGSGGGHKGIDSIIEKLGDDKFLRVRIGIGHPAKRTEGGKMKPRSKSSVSQYVLSPFDSSERGKVKSITNQTIKSLVLILKHGIDTYMSKFNKEQ